MLQDFRENPGLLYVAATLLPLASFVFLLLVGAVRSLARSRRPDAAHGAEAGRPPGRGAAYVATGAIGLACVLSVLGFAQYAAEHPAHHEATAAERQEEAENQENRWADHLNWAWVGAQPEEGVPPAPTGPGADRGGRQQEGAQPEEGVPPAPGTVLQLGYHIDYLTAVMFVMVTFVATLIHIFSIGYMSDELAPVVEDHQVHTAEGHLHRRGRFGRFFLFLSLFCFSMLNLVLADNLFQVFVSWELVGVCSYLLIGFYYERHSASTAANKAFITNRVGDAGFIIGMMILWTYVGTFNFEDLFRQIRGPRIEEERTVEAARVVRADPVTDRDGNVKDGVLQVTETGQGSQVLLFPVELPKDYQPPAPGKEVNLTPDAKEAKAGAPTYRSMPYWLLVVAGLGIFLGCVGKSAQFPLQVWLPDAMEGPTPVSALIHAATMVAAGVYLVGRVFPLFTPESRLVIAYTGGITLFVAATIAAVMNDIKKVLAYSTVSQLGYMMLALGIGGWVAGLFHLVTHAFFKALLFLCSGSVIYGCHHEQDMRNMGGLYPKMKTTAVTMLVGVLAIAGTPLFSGWYSKDAILADALDFAYQHRGHALLFALPLLTAGLTTFYMYRLWFLTFTGQPRDDRVYEHAHESPRTMTVPLVALAVCSIFVGWGLPPWQAENSWLRSVILQAEPASVHAEFGEPGDWAHLLAGNLALGLMLLGFLFALVLYYARRLDAEEVMVRYAGLHGFLEHKWYFDEFYSAALVRPALVVAGWCRAFDTVVIDGLVDFLGWLVVQVARWDGLFDLGVVDGLVNLTARVIHGVGGSLRTLQTGYIRNYVLFLVMAAVGIFLLLSYVFVAMAAGG